MSEYVEADYRAENPVCEVFPHILRECSVTASRILQPFSISLQQARHGLPACDIHHIGYPTRRDELWNVLHICLPVHAWFHSQYCPHLAGNVVCAWVKVFKNEMDWRAMSEMKRPEVWPDILETDRCRTMCQSVGEWLENWRRELINGGKA